MDWLRVLAILLLHLFHTGMMFNSWDFHLKAPRTMAWLDPPMAALHLVRMPLLMLLSGAGTALALRTRGLGAFAWDRTQRLLVPLVVGMFLVVPPQIYFERRDQGLIGPGYFAFYRQVLDFVPYPAGSFSWHHLWFVAYLFVYCLLALPVFWALGQPWGQRALARGEALLLRGPWLWLLFAPMAASNLIFAGYPETHALWGDPKVFSYYALLFLYGHLLGRCPRLWERLAEVRWWSVGLAVPLWAAMLPDGEFPAPFERIGRDAVSFWTLLAALGLARHFVHRRGPWLAYVQGLTYPFYILHQTVILAVGYAVLHGIGAIPAQASAAPGWLFLDVLLVSFVLTCAGCELIARVPLLRPLFGLPMRARERPSPMPAPLATSLP
jgi:glucan biosynthesis protein C